MSTFYQPFMQGTSKDEVDAVLDRAWKIDGSAYVQTTYTLVYRDPRVMEVINAGANATPGYSESPGGEDEAPAPVDPTPTEGGTTGRLFDVQDDGEDC